MNKVFETAYNYLKNGVQCKLSRDGGVWTCERMLSSADYPDKVFAEIMHMTQDEMEEMMQLRLSLPKESRQVVHEMCLERTKRIREKVLTQC